MGVQQDPCWAAAKLLRRGLPSRYTPGNAVLSYLRSAKCSDLSWTFQRVRYRQRSLDRQSPDHLRCEPLTCGGRAIMSSLIEATSGKRADPVCHLEGVFIHPTEQL